MLLKLEWSMISFDDRSMFFNNDEAAFLQKKQLFIVNARLTNKIKALHEKMKLLENGDERAEIANELLKFDDERANNWILIDEKTI